MPAYLLAIDQGTSSSRAIVFNKAGDNCGSHQLPIKQYYLNNAWVEHDPVEIWQTTYQCCINAIKNAGLTATDIAAIGITNQRETTIIWDKKTGEPIYPAIVWQDRRTTDICKKIAEDKKAVACVTKKTGLLIDPYFSATKIMWILEHVPNARKRAKNGELAFGTIDTYLLWQLTKGKSFFTDATNASRTLLFNIHTQSWDDELLSIFNIPRNILPDVLDCCAHFGVTDKSLFGVEIPITGIAGDQQAATIGQACFESGMMKSTFGTGAFILLNTGNEAVESQHRLLTTIAYRMNNQVTYGLEGSIFSAGVSVKWLHENLKLIASPSECEKQCNAIENTNGVYFVSAFTGLGAPYWDPEARAAILGITRDTQISHIVRAALESICYQTVDLIHAMQEDFLKPVQILQVDGGMSKNNWLIQFLSDMLGVSIQRPQCIETTALGAAFLAGLGAGVYADFNEITQIMRQDKLFSPVFSDLERATFYLGWKDAVRRVASQK